MTREKETIEDLKAELFNCIEANKKQQKVIVDLVWALNNMKNVVFKTITISAVEGMPIAYQRAKKALAKADKLKLNVNKDQNNG